MKKVWLTPLLTGLLCAGAILPAAVTVKESASGITLENDYVMFEVVKRGGKIVELTAREYNILEYMLHNIGRAVTRDNLSSHVWNYDYDGGSNVIDVYVHRLRKKLEAAGNGNSEKIVETIKGVGYIIKA
jgi:DNA-binding response OmpR family regulator